MDRSEHAETLTGTILKVDQGRGNRVWLHFLPDEGDRRAIQLIEHRPYFYCENPEEIQDHDTVRSVEEGYRSIDGDELARVVVDNPRDVAQLREHVDKPCEADVPYVRRTIVDEQCLGRCKVEMARVEDRGWVTTPESITHLDNEVDTNRFDHLYFDIEVAFDGHGDIHSSGARHPIISITVYDRTHDQYHIWYYHPTDEVEEERFLTAEGEVVEPQINHFDDEEDMLRSFALAISERGAETLCGWNSSGTKDAFDWPYILERMQVLGLSPSLFGQEGWAQTYPDNCPGIHLVDLMDVHKFATYNSFRSNSLAYVAEKVCDISYEEPETAKEAWHNDLEALLTYNLRDVEATYKIDASQDYTGFALQAMYLTFTERPANITRATVCLDSLFLLRAQQRGVVLPNKEPEDKWKTGGGFVMETEGGIYDEVASVDWSSLYPTCIVNGNISYETFVPKDEVAGTSEDKANFFEVPTDEDLPDSVFFDTSEQGLVPQVTEEIWDVKNEYDRKMKEADDPDLVARYALLRAAAKILLNSCYGYLNSHWSRLGLREGGAAVTALGRHMARTTVEEAEELGYDTIYADTDSVACKLKSDNPINEGKNLAATLEKRARGEARRLGCIHPDRFVLEFEQVYDRLLVASKKKRYAGLVTIEDGEWLAEPKLKITGFEAKRSDSPPLQEPLQKELFNALLVEGGGAQEAISIARDYLFRIENEELEDFTQAAPTPRFSKPFDLYKSNHYAVQAARYSNDHLDKDYGSGDRVEVIYLRDTPRGQPPSEYIALDPGEEVPKGYLVDTERHAERVVEGAIKRIFGALGIEGRVKTLRSRTIGDFL